MRIYEKREYIYIYIYIYILITKAGAIQLENRELEGLLRQPVVC